MSVDVSGRECVNSILYLPCKHAFASNILLTSSNMYKEFKTYLIEMKPTSS